MKYPAILGAGFMVDYACTAKCRHCLYGCSNKGSRDYVTKEKADEIMSALSKEGVRSMHIGGGEPFLNFEGLCETIKAMNHYGISVDYIETNAFWCVDQQQAETKLKRLLSLGVDTVMASCDPFHIEYVPLERVLTFCKAASAVGMGYFVWKDQFLRRLLKLDPKKTHTPDELKALLGDNYLLDSAKEYGIGMNGRALSMARELYPLKPAADVCSDEPCNRMLSGRHCHVDLYGNVVCCTGIAIPIADFVEDGKKRLYDKKEYPVLARILSGGTKELLEYAVEKGFDPETKAATKCDICYRMRRYLWEHGEGKDLGPDCFYEMMEE